MKLTIHNMGRIARDNMVLPVQVDIDPADLVFEEPCAACKMGKTKAGADCSLCGGRGVLLTDLGQHVLSFVLRNVKIYTERRYGAEFFKHQIPDCIPREPKK